jgi:hypothetical protein
MPLITPPSETPHHVIRFVEPERRINHEPCRDRGKVLVHRKNIPCCSIVVGPLTLLCIVLVAIGEPLTHAQQDTGAEHLLDVILRVFPWLPWEVGSASRFWSTMQLFVGTIFEAADIPLCSGHQVCSPPRLLPPLRLCRRAAEASTSGQNVLRCLRTHRIC